MLSFDLKGFTYSHIKVAAIFTAVILFLPATIRGQAVTITDENDIVYDIKNVGSATDFSVVVSANNAALFKNRQEAITIPATVKDHSSGADQSKTYNVVGFATNAFKGTAITAVTIEAPITEVGPYNNSSAFEDCINLQSVSLPESVTEISAKAFKGCTAMTEITGLGNVKNVRSYAFNGCSALENLQGLDKLEKIHDYGLQGCAALRQITDLNVLKEIGTAAFDGCSSLAAIDLPASMISIGNLCFQNCSALTAIDIPSGVTTIGNYAFKGCSALTQVSLHEGSLKAIPQGCFQDCISMSAPAFPPTLKTINTRAFQNCTSLGVLTLPGGISIQDYAFMQAGITKIIWPSEPFTNFGLSVFYGVSELTEVDIPGIMDKVPSFTFHECPDLVRVNILDGVKNLGEATFRKCPNLTTVTMAESLDVIGMRAFSECSKLTTPTFPARMTQIDRYAFDQCSSFDNLILPAGASVAPEAFSHTDLSSISWPAEAMATLNQPFGNQNEITSMTFPGWMETVPEALCTNWKKLDSVTFTDGVKNIGSRAFNGCETLGNIEFGHTVESIGESAFANCAISGLELPASLKSIDTKAFYYCQNLLAVEFPSGLENLGEAVFSQCNKLTDVKFTGGPSKIGNQAFNYCYKLETAILSPTLKEIGDYAFARCGNLNKLNTEGGTAFPDGLKKIGRCAFSSCTSLESVTLYAGMEICDNAFESANLSEIILPDEPCTFGDNVFTINKKITEFTFPDWMTVIPNGFCSFWEVLETVRMSENVTEIGSRAFYNNHRLTQFPFSTSIKKIGYEAFRDCNRGSGTPQYFGPVELSDDIEIGDNAFYNATVTEIIFTGCATIGKDSFANNRQLTKIVFPDCMTEIPDGFCMSWSNLTTVVLPQTLESLGKNVFKDCRRLTYVLTQGDAEDGSVTFHLPETLRKIGEGTFYRCDGLTEICFPAGELEFGEYNTNSLGIFQGCAGLKKVTIPGTTGVIPYHCFYNCPVLEEICYDERDGAKLEFGTFAFGYCKALPKIEFPEAEIVLGSGAFQACESAAEIVWPKKHTLTLGNNCFYSCKGLTDVEFPDYITDIPVYAFYNCTNLATVSFSATETTIGDNAFEYCGLTDVKWAKEGETSVIGLGTSAFANTKFTHLTVPAGAKAVGTNCFRNCTELTALTIEEGVETLGASAFNYCTKLQAVEMPGTVREIGRSCFLGDTSLETVRFSSGLEKIGESAFLNCSALREIEFPATDKPGLNIDVQAFYGCSSLAKVINHAEEISFGMKAFWNLPALESVLSTAHIAKIAFGCFLNCTSLRDFTVTAENDWVDVIENQAFQECSSLKAFPYLSHTTQIGTYTSTNLLQDEVFSGCSSLREISFPETDDYYRNILYNHTGRLHDATGLQSISFPCETTRNFALVAKDIENCPLRGISYSYADDIVPLNLTSKRATIREYDGAEEAEKHILYVKRAQRWKYIDAGYGKAFDIREMKDPQINIEGDIFSKYIDDQTDEHYNCNKYQVNLRWKLPLSDLNSDGQTVAHLYRDEVKVADIVFEKPSEPKRIDKADDPSAPDTDVIEVKYTINGQEGAFKGDFDYLSEVQADGTPVYTLIYGFQNKSLYYDPTTHKMLNTMDTQTFEPWFTFFDQFYSKPLDQIEAQESFVYTAQLEPYDYTELYNNEGLQEGVDGKLYSSRTVRYEGGVTDGVKISTAMATLKLDFTGLYTEEQIRADLDQKLAPTTMDNLNRRATFSYSLDPELVKQKGRYIPAGLSAYKTVDMISSVDLRERQADGSYTTVLTNKHNVNRQAEGTIATRELVDSYHLEPGKTYQLVTSTLFRGEFGSKTITIPGVPDMQCDISALTPTEHSGSVPAVHSAIPFNTVLTVTPDARLMGYETEMPAEGNWHVGVWRTVDDNAYSNENGLYALGADAGKTVVHHADGPVEDNCGSQCSECSQTVKSEKDGTSLKFTDLFDHDARKFRADYDTRLYVKIPESMLNTPDRWMAVDTRTSVSNEIFTDVKEVEAADLDEDAIYYDLQGRIVPHPAPGQIILRITENKAEITRVKR